MYIQLTWKDPGNLELQQKDFSLPLGIGREFARMPYRYEDQSLSRVAFNSRKISAFHAVIHIVGGQLIITDMSTNGTIINGKFLHKSSQPLYSGDVLKIEPYEITVIVLNEDGGTEILNLPLDV